MSVRTGEMVVFIVSVLVMLLSGFEAIQIGAGAVAVVAALGVCDIL